jgi:uncharacterized protein YndB with AHSA1/START domain
LIFSFFGLNTVVGCCFLSRLDLFIGAPCHLLQYNGGGVIMEGMTKISKASFTAEPGKQEVVITRVFDAPRELVFKAFTDPKLYTQWFGPRRFTMTLEKFEPRNGGSWRYIQKDKDGKEFPNRGVFHEVLKPSRIIETFEFEGLPEERKHVILKTTRFEEIPDSKTKMIVQFVYQSVASRDAMVQSGLEERMSESFNRLDELLRKMQKNSSCSQS